MLQWHAVESSAISHIGYDDGRLFIRFESSSTYIYFAVPQSVFHDFQAADSKGRFFDRRIRDRYRYQQLHDEYHLVCSNSHLWKGG